MTDNVHTIVLLPIKHAEMYCNLKEEILARSVSRTETTDAAQPIPWGQLKFPIQKRADCIAIGPGPSLVRRNLHGRARSVPYTLYCNIILGMGPSSISIRTLYFVLYNSLGCILCRD